MTEPRSTSGAGAGVHGWLAPPVLGVSLLVAAAGFGQFGVVAALGDVADEFGETTDERSIAEQAGLSGTAAGIGLAIVRLASLLSLPLAGFADRVGRSRILAATCAIGLVLTASAALSPTYWWFIAVVALSRPFLTATDVVGEVSAAEHTGSADRAKAIALVAASYAVGSGVFAVVRGAVTAVVGLRGVFALVLLPLVVVALVSRRLAETDRFRAVEAAGEKPLPVLGVVDAAFRTRLVVLASLTFAVAVITGPTNSFLFLYAENVLDFAPGATAAMVIAAAPSGLAGLLVGRWAADVVGRRVTGAIAMVALAAAGVVAYSGSGPAVVAGYLAAVAAGSVFAPAGGAIANELFPTEVRATAAGWLVAAGVLGAAAGMVAFGAIADANAAFGTAAAVVFLPAAALAWLFALVPETKGRELEEWHRA